MIRRKINYVIFLTAFALAGIAVMQAFWIKNAFKLKEAQFEHRVKIALKSVVDEMMANQPDSLRTEPAGCSAFCESGNLPFIDCVEPCLLDSLISEEFSHLDIDKHYHYGVYNKTDNEIVFGSPGAAIAELKSSPHVISLTCLYRPESHFLGVCFPEQGKIIWAEMAGWLLLSLLFIIMMIGGFSMSIISLMRQKKLSQMKADFVNNMTHEFKTPIATISIASEMLLNPVVNEDPKKIVRYAGIIHSENSRLKSQVEQVLQLAVLDKGEYNLERQQTDIHRVIEQVVKNFSLIVRKRKGEISTNLQAENHILYADKDHLMNVIMNLLDNAEKYSPNSPVITISSRNDNGGIVISIEDKGIGISQENQQNVFKQFYRVPTGDIHDVNGFGLGLFYVKTIVEAHGGSIKLSSELKKGSRFNLFFPINESINNEQQ